MEIYNFKDFQDKVARFRISPYAEAITTLAGLSPQVVGIASRLASSYASLRGTVQLLTTDEDNKIVDDTTESRETIARSAIVSAWVSMGSAVERLISLRRALGSDGVNKSVQQYPYEFSRFGNTNRAGVIRPTIFPKDGFDFTNGFEIIIPKNWRSATPFATGKRIVPLTLAPELPLTKGLFNENASLGQDYNVERYSDKQSNSVKLGTTHITGAFAVLDNSSNPNQPVVTDLVLTRMSDNNSAGYVALIGHRYNAGDITLYVDGNGTDARYLYQSIDSYPSTYVNESSMKISYGTALTGPMSQVSSDYVYVAIPSAPNVMINFDPLDPKEVFSQAYDAATAVLELLEAMGYSSGLTEDDISVLTGN